MNKELLEKARAATSPEELLKLAKENGIEDLTEEDAKAYFKAMHRSGELSDEEINVSAGGCGTQYFEYSGKRCVTPGNLCAERHDHDRFWICKSCGQISALCHCYPEPSYIEDSFGCVTRKTKYCCSTCKFYNINESACEREEMMKQ